MNGSDGSSSDNRRAYAICATISIALTFIFVAYLFRNLSSIEDINLGGLLQHAHLTRFLVGELALLVFRL